MLSEPVEQGQEDQSQDEDSLFGSPPPSPPARGRSPPPSLALPSTPFSVSQALGSGSSAQNVGTIALPGSHTHSEQSINPLALSLSLPGGSCTPVLPQSLLSSQPSSRQGSAGRNGTAHPSPQPHTRPPLNPRRKPAQPRKQAVKPNSKQSSPRPSGPEIPLPDPNHPPPAHFLRNQRALLGHAGLIAGVKPAKLTTLCGTPRGATPSNPIVLKEYGGDALTEPPMIGRKHLSRLRNVDPSKLPTPTYQEIVEILIKQKDIFPVLQNIFKLLAAGALGRKAPRSASTPGGNSWYTEPDQRQPPTKRRKLQRVPAGAADWDVPFPFQEGEGPEAYKQNWEKERGRQLIFQLLTLVKIAARKAATKKYHEMKKKRGEKEKRVDQDKEKEQNRQREGKGAKHYRDEVQLNELVPSAPQHPDRRADEQDQGLARDAGSENMTDTQLGSSPSVSESSEEAAILTLTGAAVTATTPITQSRQNKSEKAVRSTTSFDQLISSLLAAASGQLIDGTPLHLAALPPLPSSSSPQSSQLPDDPTTLFDLAPVPDGNADQALVDSWMNILQTFPLGVEGFGMDCMTLLDTHPPVELVSTSSGNPSSFASPVDSYSSSLASTPNPDAQPAQTFPVPDLCQIQHSEPGDVLMAFEIGDRSSPTSSALTPMDFTFDPPPISQDTRSSAFTPTADVNMEQPTLSVASASTMARSDPAAPQTPFPPCVQMVDDSFIDPELLALSLPRSDVPGLTSSGAPRSATLGIQSAANSDDTTVYSPPSFVPSPISSFDPATPTSAGWEISIPEVVVGGFSQDHEMRGQDLVKKPQVVQEEVPLEARTHAAPSASRNGDADDDVDVPDEAPTHETLGASTSQSAAPSDSPPPVPAPVPGVFHVLRATDLRPQEPTRKLKKSELLERAESRRKELQAELERVKVKLWEATVEHGALLHLVRLRGEAEKPQSADEVQ